MMKNQLFCQLCLLVCLCLFGACTLFHPPDRPDAAGELPANYSLYSQSDLAGQPWWRGLDAPELARLIDEALTQSLTLKEAWFRLQQVRASAAEAGADRLPELELRGTAETTRKESGSGAVGSENYFAGLAATYELDLWGRVASGHRAARLEAAASQADWQTLAVSVSAEVAIRWVQILSRQQEKELLEKQLDNNLTLLSLIELRFRKAIVSALDVYQQRQAVETVRARIPLIQAQIQLRRHELALLLGRPPKANLHVVASGLPAMPPLPALGVPADLLAHRPDVRAAGMRLQAADWQVAAARANRLPAIRLGAGADTGPTDMDLLFDTWMLSLAANLTAPLFDGGRRAAAVDRRQATADEKLWAYRRTVVTAMKEVEDALENETHQHAHIQGLLASRRAARQGLDEAVSRYRNGLIDYLPVLTQLLAVQELDREVIRQQEQLFFFRIGLYRALGGGWTAEMTSSEGSATSVARDG